MMIRRVFTRFYCVASNKTNIIKALQEQTPNLSSDDISLALDVCPQLANFHPSQWQKTLDFFVHQQNFPQESFLPIVTGYPKVFTTSLDTTFQHLEAWRVLQFGERRLQDLITKHPGLIQHGNEDNLRHRMAFLQSYVTSGKNVWRILMSSPEVVIQPEEVIREKFEYLLETMKTDVTYINDTDVFKYDIKHIKMRHIFLERLGMYKVKSKKKDKASVKDTNPKLSRIMDTSDKKFATKICNVTLEEYEVFQELLQREWDREDIDDEDENYDEMQKEQGIDAV